MAYGGLKPGRPAEWPDALSHAEFERRFPSESDTIEFKQGLSALQESFVAFSNALGGVLLAGVSDNGGIVGLPLMPQVEDKIRDEARAAHSVAPLNIRGLRVGDQGITLIGVERLREGFAQTSNGRVLVRVGTRRPALIGNELVRFMHERAASSFECVATDVAVDAVDPGLLAEVAQRLGLSEGARLSARLSERGLMTVESGREVLTVAGALYLTPRPDRTLGKAYVEILRFPNGSRDFDWREEIQGPLNRQVVEATELLMRQLGTDSVVLGLRRHDLPRLPERVVREAVANAVAHRSYEQRGTPVRIEIHRDRVEVISPGGLVPPVTVETMRDAYAARNNDVIRVLRRFDLAEDSGKGVDIIQDVMRDELLATPVFEATDSSVTVRLPILTGTRPEERAWVREIISRGAIEDRDRVLLVHARRGEVLTNQRARELLKTGRDGAMSALKRLVQAGLLTRSGERGGTRYMLAARLAPNAGLRLTRSELLGLISEMASEGPLTNQLARERTGLDRQDVLSLFDELVNRGEIRRVGERRGTHYVLVQPR